jgi:hypothetical protein
VTGALERIAGHVLAAYRALSAGPAELPSPAVLHELIADPALRVADVWSAALPPAQSSPRNDDAAYAPADKMPRDVADGAGWFGVPPAAAVDRTSGEAPRYAVPSIVRRGAPAAPELAPPQRIRSAGPDAAWWNAAAVDPGMRRDTAPVAHRSAVPPAPASSSPRLTGGSGATAPDPNQSGAGAAPGRGADFPPTSGAGAASAGDTAARLRSKPNGPRVTQPVALVRAPRFPTPPPPGAAPPGVAPAGFANGTTEHPTAGAPGVRPVSAGELLAPSAADGGGNRPAGTRMVRGAAGLASVLGAHVSSAANHPAGNIGQPPSARRADTVTAPVRVVGDGDPADALAFGADALGFGADALASSSRAADAIYDALESRLRGEFLRTYGSYGG